MNKAHIF